ncbi:nitrate reductase molybdenum cofactor assembly chaperone [Corynebacterium halotolerans]|uniref:Respiratory nitrate reductase delta chain n=1 Tax=Corynebacterium halotolerans YIM 70093 = DSM 44683 TaxID=1121362 RepID=M1NXI9_9CORY|nr:nitrate reductase molybdenum cofactor assembly chaperone [Corynebacterium halotolerans]AGF72215.1 hypothetical protein A605_06045 [Corynebacterium halotolerans YIM 70093 = DSM 44683]
MPRTHTGRIPTELTRPVAIGREQRRTLAMMDSLLLDYPDDAFGRKFAAVETQVHTLPPAVAAEVTAFLDAARVLGLRGLQTHYVETFDQRRRCSLFLSYYAVGDTRQRGAAILAFREALQSLGFEELREELPDHLCVVLEATALAEDESHDTAVELLAAHRDGIEVLRSALEFARSPYAHLITALCMALPKIDEDTARSYLDLIQSGPPEELVGLGTPLPFPTAQPDVH